MIALTAVLFVGGESRRMGADKATMLWEGEPLWSRQLRTLRELGPQKILISARTRPAWCPADTEIILDEPPSCGPLSGLAAALKRIQTTHLLALGVDLPQMNSIFVRELWQQAVSGVGVVPELDGFYEPLCAVYPVEAASHASRQIQTGSLALQSFVRTLCAANLMQPTVVTTRHLFLNLNTPAELNPVVPH
jgi:molybdopterin-guanine dinucleotide biosynthesis protein A